MKNTPLARDQWSKIRIQFVRFAQGGNWPPGYRLSEQWFKKSIIDLTFWFHYKGQAEFTDLDTGVTYPLHAGVCLLMRPGSRFTASQIGNDALSNLYFHANLLREDQSLIPPEEWPELPLHTEVSDFDFFNIASRRLLALLRHTRDADYLARDEARLAAENLFKSLILDLCHLHRMPQPSGTALYHQRAIEKALRALDEQPQRFLSVEAWAATSGYSVSHFRTLCLKCTGKSPMEHLIRVRIRQAKEYLRTSSLTIGNIAYQLGYENSHYFSRQFRQQTGMSASEYREKVALHSRPL